jgi:arylsulfatase A-like enzyme
LAAIAILDAQRKRKFGSDPAQVCADVLTLLVLGFSGAWILAQWRSVFGYQHRWLRNFLQPHLTAAIATGVFIFWRLRRSGDGFSFASYNRTSEPVIAMFLIGATILLPWRLHWRRFDQVPKAGVSAPGFHRQPDVVLVTFDALSAEDMSLLGYHLRTTPNLERLAKTSHVFTHFYSSTDFTTAAVTSLTTGKDLFAHRVYQFDGAVPLTIRSQTIADVLRSNGYRTAAVVTNPRGHPLLTGIEKSFDCLPDPPANRWLRPTNWPLQLGNTMLYQTNVSPTSWIEPTLKLVGGFVPSYNQHPSVDPADVFEAAERLLGSEAGPSFVWVHVLPPHYPYVARPPFRGYFLAGDENTLQTDYFSVTQPRGYFPSRMQNHYDRLRLRYDETILECDAALGALIDWLDSTNRRSRTLLVVTADHGESFHDWWGHESPDLRYAEVHIPLLIALPGQSTSVIHGEDTGQPDIAPTILTALGIDPPRWMTGHDVLGASDPNASNKPAFAEYLASSYTTGFPQEGTIAAFSGDYELLWYFPQTAKKLFDTRSDPYTQKNVISEHPDVAGKLVTAIRTRFGAQVPSLSNGSR